MQASRLHPALAGPAAATAAWAIAVALVAVTLAGTVALQRRAAATARAWGDTRAVWVVQQPRPAGHVLTDEDVEIRRHPAGLVPDGALDPAVLPAGRRLAAPVSAGEVLVAVRLAGDRAVTPAIGSGRVALQLDGALVSRPGGVALAPGTPVVLLLADDAVLAGPTDAVAATVLEDHLSADEPAAPVSGGSGSGGPLVAVERSDAARLATAIRQRTVVVGLVSAPPPPTG